MWRAGSKTFMNDPRANSCTAWNLFAEAALTLLIPAIVAKPKPQISEQPSTTHGYPKMKSKYFSHAKKFALRRLLCATALIACALPSALLADAPYNTNPHGPYTDDDLSIRPTNGVVTYRANTNT